MFIKIIFCFFPFCLKPLPRTSCSDWFLRLFPFAGLTSLQSPLTADIIRAMSWLVCETLRPANDHVDHETESFDPPCLPHFVVVVLVVLEMLLFIYSFIYLFLLLSHMSLSAQTQDVDTKIQTNSCWNREPYLLTCKDFPSLLAEPWFVHLQVLHFYTFLTASADFFTSFPPPLLFTNLSMSGHARVGLYAGAHPAGERARATVCYYRREGEARLLQGTPPELMFHTCAQCSTLYRASQVHCINCGRNHFIVGVLPLLCLFSGVRSITQYSHRNCF